MANEFEIQGNRYRFEGMPAQVETRITRRLAPLLSEAIPLVLAPGSRIAIRSDLDVVKIAKTALSGWGTLSDDNLDYIERATLGALSRAVGSEWHAVWPAGGAEPAFTDIDGASMQILMGRVLGFVVKQWVDGGGDTVPPEVRTVIQRLH
ncbi:phage tail assembly chaperone [Methylobacterium sp. J-067]|jgi:hypothetical protein|uniref:phage tail assembly chaperone n=1 Tax=Methylobacterium sp. J-067 TaxID=2836648 RepID=UPI001FB897E6|nr:hypothetical protein [Methylobacterium sp. J-067]MCJ2023668.1 hypothetical protein [Methylobacterium sp. J-067]